HEESPYMGLDVFEGKVVDMKEAGVLEPHRVKKQAIQSAAEAAEMILRIDDMIAAKGFEVSKKESEESGMEGMGGMPPM
ncbi:MAG: TCP-1/cpn60 chaperonin family protein, partial [Methanothermobacter sp.]|nr:TCP-1/cpn60 chaperonin family protein [Methanothermobacter sp.]